LCQLVVGLFDKYMERYKKGRRSRSWGVAERRAQIGGRKHWEHVALEETANDFAPLGDVPLGTSWFRLREGREKTEAATSQTPRFWVIVQEKIWTTVQRISVEPRRERQ